MADNLIAHDGLDEADLIRRFIEWHEQGAFSCTGRCFDTDITTRAALSRWKKTGVPQAGDTVPDTADNGSLMRLSPLAVRYWNGRDKLRDVAARQSRTSDDRLGPPERRDER